MVDVTVSRFKKFGLAYISGHVPSVHPYPDGMLQVPSAHERLDVDPLET